MRKKTLKSPLIISLIFHGLMILSVAFLYQPAKQAMLDITAIEFLQIPQEEKTSPQAIVKKEEPEKVVKPIPLLPPKQEKREDIKKEFEKISEEQKTEPVSELPAPSQTAEAKPAVINPDVPEATDSKYSLEGGTGKGSGDESALFKTMVRTKIERAKFYPRWARQRGFEGVVGVQFVIKPDGNVIGLKVVRPCHCDVLNKAACEAIMKAAPFHPMPKYMENQEMAMEIDIGFKLE